MRLFFSQSVSQSVAIYLVDVLIENKHKLGQHKGQVKKFNINEKKQIFLHQQGDCEEPIKGPLHPNSSIVVNMYLTYLNVFAKIRSRYLVSVTRKLVKYR